VKFLASLVTWSNCCQTLVGVLARERRRRSAGRGQDMSYSTSRSNEILIKVSRSRYNLV